MRTRSSTTADTETYSVLKREILRLNAEVTRLKAELRNKESQPKEATTTTTIESGVCRLRTVVTPTEDDTKYKRLLHELNSCKVELCDTKQSLTRALEEHKVLKSELKSIQESLPRDTGRPNDDESYRLAWVGKCYLAVVLPEDYMFRPGETVTPARVLHKLFEVRVGAKSATGFTVLLENAHILLVSLDYAWYKKHFCFDNGDRYANYRIDTEMFVWLLFEYGAHAPMVEILATHQALLLGSIKSGVTTLALNTNKLMYGTYFALFRETVVSAYKRFMSVREDAFKVYFEQRHVYIPVTAGLTDERDVDTEHLRSVALRSVLNSLPTPVPSTIKDTKITAKQQHLDSLDNALADYSRLQRQHNNPTESVTKKSLLLQHQPVYKKPTPDDRLHKRVTFDSDWTQCRHLASPYHRT